MPSITKPILFNGFQIDENTTIKNRVDKIFFTEVYELSNGKYLYLFTNLDSNEVLDRQTKYEMKKINIEKKEFIGIIRNIYLKEEIPQIKESLLQRKGFECVAGMESLKQTLTADVINPLTNPESFERFKVSIPNGIILYGPPGCGKTFIVRKLAEELNYNFMEVKHSDLATPYIHGAVGNIGKYFEIAKQNAPTVLFFDEISGLLPNRTNLMDGSTHKEEEINEFLVQLNDAADKKILVVGATNYIDRIDPAVLRPGRFDKKIYVSPPDIEARTALFKISLANRPHDKNIDYDHLAKITEGYSCADIIEGFVESASRMAANLNKKEIDQELIENEIPKNKRGKK